MVILKQVNEQFVQRFNPKTRIDLLEMLDEDQLNCQFFIDNYCASDYTKFERWISALMALDGWRNFRWSNLEYDSFGPLVRGLTATDDQGVSHNFFYG